MSSVVRRALAFLVVAAVLPACGGADPAAPAAAAPPPYVPWTLQNPQNVVITNAANNQQAPLIVPDGSGGAILAWSDSQGGVVSGVFLQRINGLGVPLWTANGVPVSAAAGAEMSPAIIADGTGGAIVTWSDTRNTVDQDIYVQRFNASGVPQWTADGVALCALAATQQIPRIASDGSGGAIVVWHDDRNGVDTDLYGQRVNAAGVPQWTANGLPIVTATGNQQNFEMLSAAGGDVVVVWLDRRNGSDFDLYAQRVNGAGASQWAVNGVAVTAAVGDQMWYQFMDDGAGGWIVAWSDHRLGSTKIDVYTQKLNSAGAAQWTANGVRVTSANDNQSFPRICTDGAGGVLMAWEDRRRYPLTYVDVYAQRVNAAGVPQWTADGVPICILPFAKQPPDIASDGAGGAVIVWLDPRSGTSMDAYAQRVNGAGVSQWTADGVPFATATGGRSFLRILNDGGVGIIAVWQDYRSGTNWDIYAQGFSALTGP